MARTSYAQTQIPPRGRDAVPYPDWRQFINGAMLRTAEAVSGTVIGTGAALDVPTPFDPAVVMTVNETDGSFAIKMPGQPGATALVQKAGATTPAAANAITLDTGKFTLGTNADVNTAADVIRWTAWGFSALGGA